ncbi:MAG TPA: hypothetical protein VF590_10220 [Isosphaeraceae bacterium]
MVRLPLAVLATAGPLPAAPPPDPVALARGGTALWPVVVAEDASPRIRTTAADLAGYLGTIAGATFEVTTGDGTTGLAVGLPAQFPALPVAGRWARPAVAEREDYLLHTHPRSVYLLGATEQGVEHAVWDFLHRLGYRQFFPGPRWEVVPRRPVLSAAVDVEETPAYRSRRIWYGAGLWDDNAELYRLWCVRDRATGGTQLNTGHSYGRIIQALQTEFDAHPEYDRPTHRRPEAAGLGGQEVYRQPGSAPARGGVDQGNYPARGRIVRIVWEGEAPAEPLALTARREPRLPGHRRSEPRAVYPLMTPTDVVAIVLTLLCRAARCRPSSPPSAWTNARAPMGRTRPHAMLTEFTTASSVIKFPCRRGSHPNAEGARPRGVHHRSRLPGDHGSLRCYPASRKKTDFAGESLDIEWQAGVV